MLSAASLALLASCNNDADGDKTKDSTNVTTTTDYSTTRTVEVPQATRTSFQTTYPKATNVTWRYYEPVNSIDWDWSGWPAMDTNDYVANFNMDGSDYWVWYDDGGNWIGTVSTVTDHASLPAAVNSAINSSYAGYKIVSVDRENDKNRTAYEVDLEKDGATTRVLIAEDGTILKRKDPDGSKMKSDPK